MSTQTLQVSSMVIQASEALSLLSRYQLLPQLVQNIILDRVIAPYSCTEEERIAAIAVFHQLAGLRQTATPHFEERAVAPLLLAVRVAHS
jgi:hypothetical protein